MSCLLSDQSNYETMDTHENSIPVMDDSKYLQFLPDTMKNIPITKGFFCTN